MTWAALNVNVCPVCGYDVAALAPSAGGYRVTCTVDRGGCGAAGKEARTEAGAIGWWNTTYPTFPELEGAA